MGIHFTDSACEVWRDYLYTHVPPEAVEKTTQAATTTSTTAKATATTTKKS